MIDNNPVTAIFDTPEWRDAAGLSRQSPSFSQDPQEEQLYNSWRRAASKHLRILEVVRGVEEGDEKSDSSHPVDQRQVPFHPLHLAASQGMTSAGKLVLQRCSGRGNSQADLGDVIDMPDAALGFTPLHWASITNRVDFMLLLLDAGAYVGSRDHAGRTPLYACAAFGSVDAAALLLQRGADVNAPDLRGLAPLHAAAAGNHIEVAEELVSAGACVRRRSSSGCSPRHIAERQGHVSMIELLADAAEEQSEGPEETISAVGGGDPLCWLFAQLRATVEWSSSGMLSTA